MTLKYLSPEWAEALTKALNADEGFRKEIKKRKFTMAWKVSGAPEGEVEYHLRVDDGEAVVVIGPPPAKADLQLYASYETLSGILAKTISGREAFQSRRLQSDSRLITILRYLGVFHQLSEVSVTLDVDY